MKNTIQDVMDEAIDIIYSVTVLGEDFTGKDMHRLSTLKETILKNRDSYPKKEVDYIELSCNRLLNGTK